MRWNLAVAGIAASWGIISVIVAGVDLDARALVFWRLALAAATVLAILVVARRTALLRLTRTAVARARRRGDPRGALV